jgi:hypothetical protein
MEAPRPVVSTTIHAHKRQLVWQILVPFLVVTALIVAAAVLISTGTTSATRTWADVSIIWLIAPMLVFALFFVVMLGFLIVGIAKLLQVTPYYSSKVQNFLILLSSRMRKIADGSAQPFIWSHQAGAILKSIFKL